MKKKAVVISAAAALVLSIGCATSFAAESSEYSYLTGQKNSAARNELYAQASELPKEEQDAFLSENDVGETPYSEEAAASYSYVNGRQRGAYYRQGDDTDSSQDMSDYSYVVGRRRGASYHQL